MWEILRQSRRRGKVFLPKSVKWKARARVGERVRWYEEPDEVAQGGY